MKQSSKRLMGTLLSLVFLVAAFMVFFDLIQPTYGDLQNLKGKQLSSENFLSNEQTIVSQVKKLVAQYESESQVQESLALAMPSGPDVAGALGQVYGIAQNNSIAVQTISVSPPTVQLGSAAAGGASQVLKPPGTFSFQLSAVGSYENLKNFLAQLETNIRIFDVTSLSIQPAATVTTGKTAANSDYFMYNLSVATYYELP